MKSIKLEELKKELCDLFEDKVEEKVDEILDEAINENEIQESTEDIGQSTADNGGVFTDQNETEENILPMVEEIVAEDIFSKETEEKGESQEIQKEADKPSKFKSVEELEKAYNSLQKEFTKRCQKLAQLEREMSASKVETPEQWKTKVDKFFVETPDAKRFAREIAEEISKDNRLRTRSDCLEVALSRVLMGKYRRPEDLATDEDFLREHILGSDFVKKAVIDRYMKDLREGKPPVLISRAGQNTVAPRNKPKTIADAGRLFQQHNK